MDILDRRGAGSEEIIMCSRARQDARKLTDVVWTGKVGPADLEKNEGERLDGRNERFVKKRRCVQKRRYVQKRRCVQKRRWDSETAKQTEGTRTCRPRLRPRVSLPTKLDLDWQPRAAVTLIHRGVGLLALAHNHPPGLAWRAMFCK